MKTFQNKIPLFLALLLTAIMFVQVYDGSRYESLTWDEPSYISAGYSYLTTREFKLNPSHPPLTQELIAFPLLFLDLHRPPGKPADWFVYKNPVVTYGRELIYEMHNDPLRITYWARIAPHVLGSALVLIAFFWGRKLVGPWNALIASTLIAFCPNLIAHSKVATEDISCSFFMLLAVWSFWYSCQERTIRSVLLSGVITGFALLSKFTALLLLPIYIIILAIAIVRDYKGFSPRLAVLSAAFILTCFVVTIAGYDFQPSLYAEGVSSIYTDTLPNYLFYLYGRFSPKPWWYYYLAAFIVKVPVPTIILIITSLILITVTKMRDDPHLPFLAVPPLIIITVSFFDEVNLGLRRILPAFPFLYMIVAYAAGHVRFNRAAKLLFIALLCWSAIDCIAIYPHHLSYFNEAVGGPLNAPFLLDDSNIDWGQDLPSLAQWQRQHPEARPLKLLYFGTAKPEAYGIDALEFAPTDIEAPQKGTYYAISVHGLIWFRKLGLTTGKNLDWLTKFKPVGRAGYSIYIYRF
jgi:dolichyl-phosphate-mannose-protein mannosyltransferase